MKGLSFLRRDGDVDGAAIFVEAKFGEFGLELRFEARIFFGGSAAGIEIDGLLFPVISASDDLHAGDAGGDGRFLHQQARGAAGWKRPQFGLGQQAAGTFGCGSTPGARRWRGLVFSTAAERLLFPSFVSFRRIILLDSLRIADGLKQ